MKVHIITFGCRSNQCDSRWLAHSLVEAGCEATDEIRETDLLLANTCAVTAESERQGRQALRRARRENPRAVIVATGCAVQANPAKFLSMPEIDYVADLEARGKLAEHLPSLKLRGLPTLLRLSAADCPASRFSPPHFSNGNHFRPARVPLKIQDGCDNSCSYCIVSIARGPSVSMPPDRVMNHLDVLSGAGVNEVVLTGIHLGGWGRDLDPPLTLESLVRRALLRNCIGRIRLSSIAPREITGELIDLIVNEEAVCQHLHIPLQSADEDILRAMGRNYTLHEAEVRIRLLKQAAPYAAVGLDIIVGFPGETEDSFARSLSRLNGIPFDYLHVFPFSPRPGTPAAKMEGRANHEMARERSRRLRMVSASRRRQFWEKSLGQTRKIVVETRDEDGSWRGHTDNYIPVNLSGGPFELGDMVAVKLLDIDEKGVIGEPH